ncbi:MAG: PIN domain-containing protein [Anaerolineales bacterium]|nr:PIN domain-containing protein [Anaerolineales bacterium]
MAHLLERLAIHQVIGLDTSIFIYHLEANPRYLSLTSSVLKYIESGQGVGVISTVVVMELTVHPWRINRGDIARQYEALLVNFPHLKIVEVSREVARQAAQLRANYNLRPADALQVATALVSGATAWVSNDKQLKRLETVIEVLILEEFGAAKPESRTQP